MLYLRMIKARIMAYIVDGGVFLLHLSKILRTCQHCVTVQVSGSLSKQKYCIAKKVETRHMGVVTILQIVINDFIASREGKNILSCATITVFLRKFPVKVS